MLLCYLCPLLAYGQRCGGSIDYIVRNEAGEIIDPTLLLIKTDRIALGTIYLNHEGAIGQFGDREIKTVKTVHIRTGCGGSFKVELKYKGEIMKLIFHHVPELNFYVDSIAFRPGAYEIEFGYNGYDLKKVATKNNIVSPKAWQVSTNNQ